ncbi:ferritin-like domain-containing protein [Evansella sp. LMS18]|uniref:ferritin-like domain-containing protein n=1 Tax=Evansella sp. LMS18 TaxID=2924033 RepID=UPI0020D1A9DD|nr:ferritin-like domain-containing protein [Evansella sp. LMS18]UTR08960.1 ferritin-like domain-containing protein [Evansella sp. LMS18]
MFESGKRNEYSNDRASGEYALSLIRRLARRESTEELLYDYLKVISDDSVTKRILHSVLMDERAQFRMLKELYKHLTGAPLEVQAPNFIRPESLKDGLSGIMMRKAKKIKLYTQLINNLPANYSPFLFSFINDEHMHMNLINFLLIRSSGE